MSTSAKKTPLGTAPVLPAYPTHPLTDLVRNGDINAIISAFNDEPDLLTKIKNAYTLIILALKSNKPDVVGVLMDKGVKAQRALDYFVMTAKSIKNSKFLIELSVPFSSQTTPADVISNVLYGNKAEMAELIFNYSPILTALQQQDVLKVLPVRTAAWQGSLYSLYTLSSCLNKLNNQNNNDDNNNNNKNNTTSTISSTMNDDSEIDNIIINPYITKRLASLPLHKYYNLIMTPIKDDHKVGLKMAFKLLGIDKDIVKVNFPVRCPGRYGNSPKEPPILITSPLHYAVRCQAPSVTRYLLSIGASFVPRVPQRHEFFDFSPYRLEDDYFYPFCEEDENFHEFIPLRSTHSNIQVDYQDDRDVLNVTRPHFAVPLDLDYNKKLQLALGNIYHSPSHAHNYRFPPPPHKPLHSAVGNRTVPPPTGWTYDEYAAFMLTTIIEGVIDQGVKSDPNEMGETNEEHNNNIVSTDLLSNRWWSPQTQFDHAHLQLAAAHLVYFDGPTNSTKDVICLDDATNEENAEMTLEEYNQKYGPEYNVDVSGPKPPKPKTNAYIDAPSGPYCRLRAW